MKKRVERVEHLERPERLERLERMEHLEHLEHLEQRSVRTACLSGCAIPFRFSASSALKILFFQRRGRRGRRDGGTVGRKSVSA